MTRAYKLYLDGPVFLVRWWAPSIAAADELLPRILRRHQELGRQLYYAALVGPDCKAPDAATRERFMTGYADMMEACDTVRMVVFGGSLRQVLMRTAISAMAVATRLAGQDFKLDRSLRALAEAIEVDRGVAVEDSLRAWVDEGLCSSEEL